MQASTVTHFLGQPAPGSVPRGMHGPIDKPLPFLPWRRGPPRLGQSPPQKRGTPAFCSTKLHKLLSHPRFATAHKNADPAAYFSQQLEPGAPYLRGTSHVYQSRCQGPLSAPEPRTHLLEAEERSHQGPRRKRVQLSKLPSPSFFRASSFGKSLRQLPKARRHANRDDRNMAVPLFPRQQAKRLATSTLPYPRSRTVFRVTNSKAGRRCCNHYGRYAYAAEGGTVIGACGSSIEYCAPRSSHRRAMTDRESTRTGASEIPHLQEPTGSLRHPTARRLLPRMAGRRRPIVGSSSCTLERSGGHSAGVSRTRSLAYYRRNHGSSFVLRRSFLQYYAVPQRSSRAFRALRARVQWRVESRPISALRRLYLRPPPGRPSKVAVLASAGRNNLSRGAAPHSGSPVGKSRPRVQTGSQQKVSGADAAEALTLHDPLIILPQVHLRKPCYDFYFL
ncbi:hypothetical protein MRX96_058804 [Rhipicephalus microplus]